MAQTSNAPKKEDVKGVVNDVKNAAGDAYDKAKSVAGDAYDKAKDMAGKAGDTASSAMHTAGQKADDVVSAVGGKVQGLAGTVRDAGPKDGMLGGATRAVADTMENTGRYLQDQGVSGMMGDFTDLVKRNPVPALLIGIGVGYLLGRALDRS